MIFFKKEKASINGNKDIRLKFKLKLKLKIFILDIKENMLKISK